MGAIVIDIWEKSNFLESFESLKDAKNAGSLLVGLIKMIKIHLHFVKESIDSLSETFSFRLFHLNPIKGASLCCLSLGLGGWM